MQMQLAHWCLSRQLHKIETICLCKSNEECIVGESLTKFQWLKSYTFCFLLVCEKTSSNKHYRFHVLMLLKKKKKSFCMKGCISSHTLWFLSKIFTSCLETAKLLDHKQMFNEWGAYLCEGFKTAKNNYLLVTLPTMSSATFFFWKKN